MTEQDVSAAYNIERLKPADTEAMLALHSKVWLDTFANDTFGLDAVEQKARLDQKSAPEELSRIRSLTTEDVNTADRVWFVAKDEQGKVIGMARPYRADEEGLQRVGALYVDKEYQGRGVSGALMDKVVEWSDSHRPLYLWVAVKNERARRFYEKRGFSAIDSGTKLVYGSVPHIKMVREGDEA